MKCKLDQDILKKTIYNTLTIHFHDHNFYFSLHPYTDNNHITVIKKSLFNVKNLNINKSLLNKVKLQFAINLQLESVNATFSSATDKQSNIEIESARLKRENRLKDANVYKIVDFGQTNYQLQINGKQPVLVKLIDNNCSEKTIWLKQINRFLNENKAAKGDKIIIQSDKFLINKNQLKFKNLSLIII